MNIDIFSDVVCPWCYLGKRRFESALGQFAHRDEVVVTWRSFQLDPGAPVEADRPVGYLEALTAKLGGGGAGQAEQMLASMAATAAQEGLDYRFDIAQQANTFDAHRLLHLAAERGVQAELTERLFRAVFSQGRAVGARDTLVELAAASGLDAGEVAQVIDGQRYAAEVRADQAQARAYGISSVPFFVVQGTYGVSGAQPAEALLQVLEQAWQEDHPLTVLAAGGARGDGDSCAV